MVCKHTLVALSKWRRGAIPHPLHDADDGLVGEGGPDEEIWNPVTRANIVLRFEGIFFDHWYENIGIERVLGMVQPISHICEHGYDRFIRLLRGIWIISHFCMGGIEELLPCCIDVGFIPVICTFIDHQADIEVAGLICVVIE